MHLYGVIAQVYRHICIMQEVVHEILLYDMRLITEADDKFGVAVGCIYLHYMPQNGFTAYLYHRLGLQQRLFRYPGAPAARKYYYLHFLVVFILYSQNG